MSNVNLIIAFLLSIIIILGWQYFFEHPKYNISQSSKIIEKKQDTLIEDQTLLSLEESLSNKINRVPILTDKIQGFINLQGARIDYAKLMEFKKTVDPNSDNVEIFHPANTKSSYFTEVGWQSQKANTKLPNESTIWKADKEVLNANTPVTLTWTNEDNVEFNIKISIDNNYMFHMEQSVINNSSQALILQSYGLINRNYDKLNKKNTILHEGPIAVINEELKEYNYEKLQDEKSITVSSSQTNWIGITDKYWLTAFIPDQSMQYTSNFTHQELTPQQKRIQTNFTTKLQVIEPGEKHKISHMFFLGAKKVNLLDFYAKQYNIKLFDRAIDFGWLYVLTKPLFHILNFFYKFCGNFGVSILIITVIIKLLMFGLSSKSYGSMKKLKALQPQIERIKELYSEDKIRLNQETMELYKRNNVNPISGCLPLLIQIPVFFSVYKVLYVTIEMRHAPFFGWIKDLSAPDPTSILNLFGLLPIQLPSMLQIGIWPLLMSITMYIHQKLTPTTATDEMQIKMMRLMPLIFLFIFNSFPAGLLVYWTWSNILSIMQQYYIAKN